MTKPVPPPPRLRCKRCCHGVNEYGHYIECMAFTSKGRPAHLGIHAASNGFKDPDCQACIQGDPYPGEVQN